MANAALVARESASAAGPKRSFRRHAVIRQRRKPRKNAARVAGLSRISIFWTQSEIQSVSRTDDYYFRYRRFPQRIDNIVSMETVLSRTRLWLVAMAYAGVLAVAVVLIVARYVQYVTHPADVAAYGGMYAGGDLMLEVFILAMLLLVTFFLVLVIYKSEPAYTIYAKVLVGLSLTAPLSVGLISIPAVNQGMNVLGEACMFRLFASPLVALGIGASRLFARFALPKKLTVYALLIEGFTLVGMGVLLFSHS